MSEYGILALAPPLVAIILAMVTRQTLVSLFAGVWIGALMIANWNPIAATALSTEWIVEVIMTPFNARFLMLIMFMGAGAAFIYKSGGIIALEQWIGHRIKTARDSQVLTWLIGIFIFFDSIRARSLLATLHGNSPRKTIVPARCTRMYSTRRLPP